ncbi:MAG: hypothetical protein IIA61_04730 [Candidatus Marinimicrobia bacterium]|nr:hypothetical protein [Candidatus Neomarinimicrobiota bacterium]
MYIKKVTAFIVCILGLAPSIAMACATCFGAPDAPMTHGMNMAIISLMGITGTVLGGIVIFFISLIRKSKKVNSLSPFHNRGNGSTHA